MSNTSHRGCAESSPIDRAAIVDVVQDFGELTAASSTLLDARLGAESDESSVRTAYRRMMLELIAGKQALALFGVMDGLLPPEYRQDVDRVRAILARSYAVGIGFGLLPNRGDARRGSLDEETALAAIRANPRSWLQFEADDERFTYTEQGQEWLRSAYVAGRGCPLIGLEAVDPRTGETTNVFVACWGNLAREYEPQPPPGLVDQPQ